jgi:hypothetical protein
VELAVGGEPGADVALAAGGAHRGEQRLGPLRVGRSEAVDGQRQRQRLEQDPARVQLVKLLWVEPGHPRALVGLDLDQALLLQHPQHLAQRGAAHSQLLGQGDLGQLGARLEGAVQDALAQIGVQDRNGLADLGQVQLLELWGPDGGSWHAAHYRRCDPRTAYTLLDS